MEPTLHTDGHVQGVCFPAVPEGCVCWLLVYKVNVIHLLGSVSLVFSTRRCVDMTQNT